MHVNQKAGFFGGVERILYDIASGLCAEGHPQALLHGEPDADRKFCTPFESVGTLHEDVESTIGAFGPDVLLVHKVADDEVIPLLSRACPTVRMIHDHDLVCLRRHKYFPISDGICDLPAGISCYTRLCFVTRAPSGSRWPVEFRRVSDRKRAIFAHRDVRRFVVGSRWMRQELVVNGVDKERVDIHPPIPRSLQSAVALPAPGTAEVLYVGQVIRGKGVDLMLRALARLHRAWHATIVGTGNHLEACKQLARQLGVSERVSFVGWVDHESLESYFAGAAVAVVPSRWPEPFGMVGIEAMARGRPVVGFAAGGITDWLFHEVNGLLAPPADVAMLATHLDRLLSEPALAERLGAEAARIVKENYRHERFLGGLMSTFERAADRRPAD
ncbi:MAG: glycosyltransferase family 4 protein [Thiohalocapsa sp.]|nr:glycosyltransferase family 4 protein [Thiohalocapsa sp.]MCF7991025.1 glycosyltransferase family 4 protein [Thiohalocapsa sp.]